MSEETAILYTERRCTFQSGDGSPVFTERQLAVETLDDFVARMLDIKATSGGYLIIAAWHRTEVYDDPDAAALAAEYGS